MYNIKNKIEKLQIQKSSLYGKSNHKLFLLVKYLTISLKSSSIPLSHKTMYFISEKTGCHA